MKKIWSRLDGVVLFHHTGFERNHVVTGSFKVLPLRFRSAMLARSLPEGWYRIVKRLANRCVVVGGLDDIEPISVAELVEIGWRMRIRFAKLVKKVRETRKRRISYNMMVVPFSDVPFIADHSWFVYVSIPRGEPMNIDRIPRGKIYELIKEREEDFVVVYLAEAYAGILHFL